jgi:hypothetical protein
MNTKPILAFTFIGGILLFAGSITYGYEAPKIVYGESMVVPCVADSEDMVLTQHYKMELFNVRSISG